MTNDQEHLYLCTLTNKIDKVPENLYGMNL